MNLGAPTPQLLRARARIVHAIRGWLHERGFVEIEAPTLVRAPALEPYLEAFQVVVPPGDAPLTPPPRSTSASSPRWLHTSPEFALKRVLAAGLPRIFSIGPCFRAEEMGPHHGAEFTMLEWYRAGVGYRGIMDDMEGLLAAAADAVGVALPPVERLSFREALARHSPRAESDVASPADPNEVLRRWVNDVELRLVRPTIIYDYPADQAAFSEIRGDVAERFEVYWRGVELANAFTELLDPAELRARWAECNATRDANGRPPYPVDERLVSAVGRHPRCGGVALGLDRLVMLLLGRDAIHEVRLQG